jgi:hypothetical protein
MLFDKRMIPRIWSKIWLREISDPTAEEDDGLEDQHNGVHIWVDGHVNNRPGLLKNPSMEVVFPRLFHI